MKISKKQGREGKVYPIKHRVQKKKITIRDRKKRTMFLQWTVFNNSRKQQKGKDSSLFRKIRNIKGPFCPKMGTIKDKNGRDPVDAE